MSLNRREFVSVLAAAAAAELPLAAFASGKSSTGIDFYDLPRYGNVSLLHLTDCHAQLGPVFYREPSVNLGAATSRGRMPHLTGEHLLKATGIARDSREAYALTCVNFETLAKTFGKVGGFAHLATLLKRLRASRPGALLLDGGDTWQGSGLALWSQGADMVDAQLQLGVDVMTGHWEFTYGMDRVRAIVDGPFKGKVDFVAQNIATQDFGDPVFPAYSMREVNGVQVAVIGQAFPYTPVANPRHFVADWRFGIEESQLQKTIDAVRRSGALVVVLLSHNGLDVDLQLASRVRGLDAILGGHTHDGLPQPLRVRGLDGREITVTNAGSNGKFLGVLDFDVRGGKIRGSKYRLLPVFSNLLDADSAMTALILRHRAPFSARLDEVLAVTEGILFRRGNFNGTFDQLILNALMKERDAPIAFSPGFRWGTTLLPGESITVEQLMNQTAITYPQVTVNEMSGAEIKAVLEDVADNLFNRDPYYQQGGDMVRVGGLRYACAPWAAAGQRISDLRLGDEPLSAAKKYRVAGWASVAPHLEGEPIYDLVARYLRAERAIKPLSAAQPDLRGVAADPGIA